jgi:DNA polymerase (family 10)
VSASATLRGTLAQLADLSEIRGATATAADLRRSVAAIDAMGPAAAARLEQRARRDNLAAEPGISPTVHWRLREIALGGHDVALTAARAGVPHLIRRLLELPALTTDQAAMLVRQLGVLTRQDLHAALDADRVKATVGEAIEARLRQASDALDMEVRPFTLGRTCDVYDTLLATMASACPALDAVTPAGGFRRFEPLVAAMIVVARTPDPPLAIDALCTMPGADDVLHRSARRAILLMDGVEVDIRVAAPDEYGTVLFSATGSREHASAVQRRRPGTRLAAREEDVYAQARLPYIEPELRSGGAEIAAADSGTLPRLVTHSDIRGDLHMHSTYSDGRDTIAVMAAACEALGYEYIAISDHSEGAAASRTLLRDQIAQQREEIARVQEMHPRLTILHGVEVDILPNGRLDFDDRVLEGFDIVLASLHEGARQDAKTLTRRCLDAIRHPLVNVITHPANRLVGRRTGYPLEWDAVYAAAAETGTALEIDGAPSHLDLDGEHARAAVAAGVTVTIDSDCHRSRSLERQMRLGVGTARRGWVEARHVLNTRPIAEVRAFVARKRRR